MITVVPARTLTTAARVPGHAVTTGTRGGYRSAPPGSPGRVAGAGGPFTRSSGVRTVHHVVGDPQAQLRVLVVCTGNLCRSPLAAALLQREFTNLGAAVQVRSAGTDAINGLPVPRPMIRATTAMLVDLTRHRATRLRPEHVEDAHLIITMTRWQLRSVVGLVRSSFASTFTLRELARRAAVADPSVTAFDTWLEQMNEGRRPEQYVADDPADDVDDPQGRPLKVHRRVALEVESLVWQVADRWPVGATLPAHR